MTPTSSLLLRLSLLSSLLLSACASTPEPQKENALLDPAPAPAPVRAGNAAVVASRVNAHQADADFAKLVDAYFEGLFAAEPLWATWLGRHDFDATLGAQDRAAIDAEVARVRGTLEKLKAIAPKNLSGLNPHDHRILEHHLQFRLFSLSELKPWAHNPMHYNDLVSGAVHALIKRDFAPAAQRATSLLGRLGEVPKVLEAARTNLDNPPKVFTEMAVELTEGSLQLFDDSLPAFAEGLSDAAQRDSLKAAIKTARDAVAAHLKWLREDLLPRSGGDFVLGEERYKRMLWLREMVDTPIDVLLTQGIDALRSVQKDFVERATMIDPLYSPKEVLERIGKADHPAPDALVPETDAMLAGLKQFVVDAKLLTVPAEAELKVAPMPPFWWGFAAMDAPGPFEDKAKEAYYYVDTPGPGLDKKALTAHMQRFSRPQLRIISVHEAWPGHYVEALVTREVPSKVRRVLWSYAFSEGWAHYTEQMVLEEGLGRALDDEARNKLYLAQQSEALIRLCRYIVSLRMHNRGMTLDEAVAFFQKEGYADEQTARREATRGTFDPMYLAYTLGKMLIYEMREDYQRSRGEAYTLADFHDRFLRVGSAPLAIHKEVLKQVAATP